VNKAEWIQQIRQQSGETLLVKQVEAVVNAMVASIAPVVNAEGRLQVHGLGTFIKKHKAARQARNPRTGEPVAVAEKWGVGFKAAPGFLASLETPPPTRKGARRASKH
jgi:nucleoid DNA-binding protein